MGEVTPWLIANWQTLLATVGGGSGLVSAAWTYWRFHREERMKTLARLSITTTGTPGGWLRLELGFSPEDRAEPLAAIIRVRRPKRGVAIERQHILGDGPTYDPSPGSWLNTQQAREIEVPLAHENSTSASGTATVFVAVQTEQGEPSSIDSSIVEIRVVRRISRKRLISVTRTVSATA